MITFCKINRNKKCDFSKIIKFLVFSFIFVFVNLTKIFSLDYYWENSVLITQNESRFPKSVSANGISWLFWQEVDLQKNKIYISARRYKNHTEYDEALRFAGPFLYAGEIPDIFSAAIKDDANVAVAVSAEERVCVYYSENSENILFSRSEIQLKNSDLKNNSLLTPRIYAASQNKFRIFISDSNFVIYTSVSDTGQNWENLKIFLPEKLSNVNSQNPFVPYLATDKNRDIVVFQAQRTIEGTSRFSYQIFSTFSVDGGNSWSEPYLLSDSNSLSNSDSEVFSSYQNQSPVILYSKNNQKFYVNWERSQLNSFVEIRSCEISNEGKIIGKVSTVSGSGNAHRGIFFEGDKKLNLVWFEQRRGTEGVYYSQLESNSWNEASVSVAENSFSNMFCCPLVFENQNEGQQFSFVWQQSSNSKSQIAIKIPDMNVSPPKISSRSFTQGRASNKNDPTFTVEFPSDSSGIAGYSYSWSQDFNVVPEKRISDFTRNPDKKVNASKDGKWYFKVIVRDYAGNWSIPEVKEFVFDSTPPSSVDSINFPLDEYGFASSNTIRFSWNFSNSQDCEGYSYRFIRLGSIPKTIQHTKENPLKISFNQANEEKIALEKRWENRKNQQWKSNGQIITRTNNSRRYSNYTNGVYLFSVVAIDEAGNSSESFSQIVILNKYQATTKITSVEQSSSYLLEKELTIRGDAFEYDGTITKIYIDKDGNFPYDIEFNQNEFNVDSDSKISGIKLPANIEKGEYRIGLFHSSRGLTFSSRILSVEQSGTVKIQSNYEYNPKYSLLELSQSNADIITKILKILLCLVLIFAILLILIFTKDFIQEKIEIKNETNAIIKKEKLKEKGIFMKKDKERKRKNSSLRRTITLFTSILVMITISVAIIRYAVYILQAQRHDQTENLQKEVEILMESISIELEVFLPDEDILQISSVPSQKDAVSEINYITILGHKLGDEEYSTDLNYVWNSNDPAIISKVKSETLLDSNSLNFGLTEISDETLLEISKSIQDLNEEAKIQTEGYLNQLSEIQKNRMIDESELLSQREILVRNNISSVLTQISKDNTKSIPEFNAETLSRNNMNYIFYKPVMYRKGQTGVFANGVIIVEASSKNLLDEIDLRRSQIIHQGGVVGVIAIVIGILVSFILALLIVRPIKLLEKHVLKIRDTDDKEDLDGEEIHIKSQNEIGRLGDAVNELTVDLVRGAREQKLTLDGKAVQNAFLPLSDKSTTAKLTDSNIECYGYYEGASGVSGDYFDYRKLDDEWYAIIKCDASGHGVPAAIIMTVVATLFRRYFDKWSYSKNGTKIDSLMIQINDFIEELGLSGKFAAFILCLLNVKTGEMYLCNSGDKFAHIYDSKTQKIKTLELQNTPASGSFNSMFIEMKGGFKVEKFKLNKGDILLLYTDGIEESKRYARNQNYEVINDENGEAISEEFGNPRIFKIIESVMKKEKFILEKNQNPIPDEILEFDFTKCDSNIENSVIALASAEKIFRIYDSHEGIEKDKVQVDRKIDEFLEKFFNRYKHYASSKVDLDSKSNYVSYHFMKEDEQEDDLTILAVMRK